VREHLDSDGAEQLAANRTHRGSRSRFAGARALEDVAQIMPIVFQSTREVGVTGARPRERLGRGRKRAGRHPVEPVAVIAVYDRHRDRTSERLAGADASEELDAIGLDLHSATTAVTALSSGEILIHIFGK
jgi:hypothetical protein